VVFLFLQRRHVHSFYRGMVTIPYVKGLSEAFSRILKTYRICTAVKPHTTFRNLLVHPKDRISDEEKPEVVYKIPCLSSGITWSELNHSSLSKRSTGCITQDPGKDHSILLSVTHMLCINQVCHGVSCCVKDGSCSSSRLE